MDIIVTYSCSNRNILGEDDSLPFNDEEVDEIFEIIERRLQDLFGDLVVSAWPDGTRNTRPHESFARGLGEGDDCFASVVSFQVLIVPNIPPRVIQVIFNR